MHGSIKVSQLFYKMVVKLFILKRKKVIYHLVKITTLFFSKLVCFWFCSDTRSSAFSGRKFIFHIKDLQLFAIFKRNGKHCEPMRSSEFCRLWDQLFLPMNISWALGKIWHWWQFQETTIRRGNWYWLKWEIATMLDPFLGTPKLISIFSFCQKRVITLLL